jgi:hypothetical protein
MAGGRVAGHSPACSHLHCTNLGSAAIRTQVRQPQPGREETASQAPLHTDLPAMGSSGPLGGRESHKWEPTQSAALGLSATHSECPCRSRAPRSTQSDGDRHPEPLWISLTRKRSLVQIQYGPRHFFEILSNNESPNRSQRPAALSRNRWSGRRVSALQRRSSALRRVHRPLRPCGLENTIRGGGLRAVRRRRSTCGWVRRRPASGGSGARRG